MSNLFNYQVATVEEIAAHLNTLHRQSYFRVVAYYTQKKNLEMITKIEQARKLSKILKMQEEYAKEFCA